MRIAIGILSATFILFGMSDTVPARFEKVSDHFYFLRARTDGANVGLLLTDDGLLMIDPPADAELAAVMDAAKRISARPVRWVVDTSYERRRRGSSELLSRRGATLITSTKLRQLALCAPQPLALASEEKVDRPGDGADHSQASALVFDRQMHVFSGDLEVRIISLQHAAHTGGDVVVFIPAERILQVGDMFIPGSYPEIDRLGEGNASGWIDAVKEIIDAVPLLKAAIPPRSESSKTQPEPNTLEESVTIIPGYGPRSNLLEFKTLLETAQKLRSELGRTVRGGRSRENFVGLPSLSPFRSFNNFDNYAVELFDDLSSK